MRVAVFVVLLYQLFDFRLQSHNSRFQYLIISNHYALQMYPTTMHYKYNSKLQNLIILNLPIIVSRIQNERIHISGIARKSSRSSDASPFASYLSTSSATSACPHLRNSQRPSAFEQKALRHPLGFREAGFGFPLSSKRNTHDSLFPLSRQSRQT